MLRITSLLAGLGLLLATGCKKTDESTPAPTPAVPTSMVGNWKVSAFTLNPAWSVAVNGSSERFTDYVQYLKRINETCLTDVVLTFAAGGKLTNNLNSLVCENKGGNSKLIVDYLFEPNGTYAETSGGVNFIGTDNVANQQTTKVYGPNSVALSWNELRDISNQAIPTTYTLTLTKQ